jgi:hypothetical protein
MEIKITCPLGSKCEEAKDGYVERCVSWINIRGKHPQTEEIIDQWNCGLFFWQPILTLENAQTNRGQTDAICSFRDEMVKGQERVNQMIQIEGNLARILK